VVNIIATSKQVVRSGRGRIWFIYDEWKSCVTIQNIVIYKLKHTLSQLTLSY